MSLIYILTSNQREIAKNLNIKYNKDKPVIPTKLSLNCDKAFTELNWFADTPFEEGIKKTMEWYKNNIH